MKLCLYLCDAKPSAENLALAREAGYQLVAGYRVAAEDFEAIFEDGTPDAICSPSPVVALRAWYEGIDVLAFYEAGDKPHLAVFPGGDEEPYIANAPPGQRGGARIKRRARRRTNGNP